MSLQRAAVGVHLRRVGMVLLLGERLDASLLVGGVLAIAGVVVANRARQ